MGRNRTRSFRSEAVVRASDKKDYGIADADRRTPERVSSSCPPASRPAGIAGGSDVDDLCRLCGAGTLSSFQRVGSLDYLRCRFCQGTLLARRHLPPLPTEEAHYRLHRNDVNDAGYRLFLERLVRPLAVRLEPGSIGLDYGCGPGPAGAAMLRERGHTVIEYDPLFAPAYDALDDRYDFVFCSEVVEHFHEPFSEFGRINSLLRPGGWLAIMTCFQTDDAAFENWHYRRDPTHVAFYREHTFHVLARRFDWTIQVPARNVVLLRKS